MIPLIRAELLKLRSTRTALGLLIVILVVTLVPLILLISLLPKDWLAGDGVSELLAAASALVPLVLLVFGILGMTNEYRHGTITYSYLVTPRRWQVMVIKLVVYALVGIVTMLVAVVLVYVVIRIGGSVRGVDLDPSGGATIGDYARQIIVAGLTTTFGVALGALIRAQIITVAGALIWALFVENIIVVLKPTIGSWLPFVVFNQVSAARMSSDGAEAVASVASPAGGLSREHRLHRHRQPRGDLHLAAPRRHLSGGASLEPRTDRWPPRPLTIRGPLSGQGAVAEGILRALPDWFGIEEALVDYARAADELPTFVAEAGGEPVGFLTLRPTSSAAVEYPRDGRATARAPPRDRPRARRARGRVLPSDGRRPAPREDTRARRPLPALRGDPRLLRSARLPAPRRTAAGLGAGEPVSADGEDAVGQAPAVTSGEGML